MIDGNATPTHRVCANESRVELSILNGLRHRRMLKDRRRNEFEKEVAQASSKVAQAEEELATMQAHLNSTCEEAEEIVTKVENMTTPELMELVEQQICAEDEYPTDCCHVSSIDLPVRGTLLLP